MISKIIGISLRNRFVVLLLAAGIFAWGVFSVRHSNIDAIPDLSENQVIVYTEWSGRSAQVIEDQITFPMIAQLQGLPSIKNVRGTSMFGMSFIYLIFEDREDIYQARQRVLERLNTVSAVLPPGIVPSLGPDGTGAGHVLWYTLNAPGMDLGEQRAVQDWYVRFALQNVSGVSEVASFGGFEKQYQVMADPSKLIYYGISLPELITAIRSNNNETGGSKLEQGEIGYVIRTTGYLKSEEDIENITVKSIKGAPIKIRNLAEVETSGATRTGIVDYNGDGEAVGGIVVMRYGANANDVIQSVKTKMTDVAKGLPEGVSFNIVYDRSGLIAESVSSIQRTLIEEMIVVSLVVFLFLLHWRSAVSILIQIPISIAASFILLNAFGISSNIMSLTGIALAIGVIVDNGIIMSENSYRNLALHQEHLDRTRKD